VRRQELEALGIQLPVLPTMALGPLPGGAGWSARLARIGLDVTASGAERDTAGTLAAARAAAPHLALKARAAAPGPLAALGPLIVEGAERAAGGCYLLRPGEEAVEAVDGADPRLEDVMDVARRVLARARAGSAAALWVVATPGLDGLPKDLVEAKLAALVEGARQARLYLVKEQFEI
jgi:hypothetical protein